MPTGMISLGKATESVRAAADPVMPNKWVQAQILFNPSDTCA
jgi:hypothetical protein